MFDGTINRCLVRIKDPQVIDVLSPRTNKSRYKKRKKTKIRTQQYL